MTEVCEIFLKGLIFVATAAVVIAASLFVVGATIKHFTPQPTPDELYGCSLQQQAPNGDCK